MLVLGLDASTSTIGIAVLDHDGTKPTLVHHEYFKPPKLDNFIETLHLTKLHILQVLISWQPDVVAIEEYIQFMKGSSGAKTIIPLAIINRTICLAIYEETKQFPVIMNVLAIRHAIKFDKKLPAKEEIPDLVARHLNIDFPYIKKTIKGNKSRPEKIKNIEENNDMADAMAVGLAYLIKGPPKPKKKKKAKKRK